MESVRFSCIHCGCKLLSHCIWPSISFYPVNYAYVRIKSDFPCFRYKKFHLKGIKYFWFCEVFYGWWFGGGKLPKPGYLQPHRGRGKLPRDSESSGGKLPRGPRYPEAESPRSGWVGGGVGVASCPTCKINRYTGFLIRDYDPNFKFVMDVF